MDAILSSDLTLSSDSKMCRCMNYPYLLLTYTQGEAEVMATCTSFATSYKLQYHQSPTKFIQCNSSEVPCPEALGYIQGKTLGSGTYAKVKAAWSPYENQMIAIKNLHKKAASNDYLAKFLPREIEILQLVNHPNILQVHRIIETGERCFFMLEIAENGDLLDYINARGHIPENESRYIFRQMTCGIAFCHSINVAHRDLKCENVMISRDMQIKIGDFGFAVRADTLLSTPCGSYSYAAPELFSSDSRGYCGKKADVWSLGVILFAVVCGRLPFGDDSQVKKSNARVLTFNRHIGTECKGILRGILNINPDQRFTCETILLHAWTNGTARCPSPLQFKPKYTIENCLPLSMPHPQLQPMSFTQPTDVVPYAQEYMNMRPSTPLQTNSAGPSRPDTPAHSNFQTVSHVNETRYQQRQSKPLVAKIGAAGRRLADAMRHMGQSQNSSRPSSAKPKK